MPTAASGYLMGSPPILPTALVVLSTPRNASFTACSERKASALVGSIGTMFVPSRARPAYLPRTPPFMDAKSYSARMSSASIRFVFFTAPSLAPCRTSGADDTDDAGTGFSMRSHEDSARCGPAQNRKALLLPSSDSKRRH